MMPVHPQSGSFSSFPGPNQPSARILSQFEFLPDTLAFDPKNLSSRAGHNQFAALFRWNLPVRKPILKFHRSPHADGLKAIPRLPVSQNNVFTSFVRVKDFSIRGGAPKNRTPHLSLVPANFRAVELQNAGLSFQTNCGTTASKDVWRYAHTKHPPRVIALNVQPRRHRDCIH